MSENEVTTITVAGSRVGMLGLTAIFAELKAAGVKPSEQVGAALVERAAEHNYVPDGARAEYAEALLNGYRRYLGEDVPEEHSIFSVKVLGLGCHNCETLASNVKSALAELGVPAEFEHVSDLKRIGEYGPLPMPVLILNGKIMSTGKALSVSQVARLISDARSKA